MTRQQARELFADDGMSATCIRYMNLAEKFAKRSRYFLDRLRYERGEIDHSRIWHYMRIAAVGVAYRSF
jgi:hypothetical protein